MHQLHLQRQRRRHQRLPPQKLLQLQKKPQNQLLKNQLQKHLLLKKRLPLKKHPQNKLTDDDNRKPGFLELLTLLMLLKTTALIFFYNRSDAFATKTRTKVLSRSELIPGHSTERQVLKHLRIFLLNSFSSPTLIDELVSEKEKYREIGDDLDTAFVELILKE
jgi:hypothetical protein